MKNFVHKYIPEDLLKGYFNYYYLDKNLIQKFSIV